MDNFLNLNTGVKAIKFWVFRNIYEFFALLW